MRGGLGIALVCGLGACGGGEPVSVVVTMSNISEAGALVPAGQPATDQTLAPGVLIVHDDSFNLYAPGMELLWNGFETMVEDGDNAALFATLQQTEGVIEVVTFATLDDTYAEAPMHPGDSASVSVDVLTDQRLSFATMMGQSNDLFLASPAQGLLVEDVLDAGELSGQLALWDAGTEVSEEPGAGPNQAPRQASPGDGEIEHGTVTEVTGEDPDGWVWPAPEELVSFAVKTWVDEG